MAKLSFLVGFGAGYVLGAKAGTERYEQIRRAWEHAKDNPQLQGLAGMAQARADGVLNSARARVGMGGSDSSGGRSTADRPGTSRSTTDRPGTARSAAGTTSSPDTPLPPPDTAGGL